MKRTEYDFFSCLFSYFFFYFLHFFSSLAVAEQLHVCVRWLYWGKMKTRRQLNKCLHALHEIVLFKGAIFWSMCGAYVCVCLWVLARLTTPYHRASKIQLSQFHWALLVYLKKKKKSTEDFFPFFSQSI